MPHLFERISNRSIEGNILKLIFDGKGEFKGLDFDLSSSSKKLSIEDISAARVVIGHYDGPCDYRIIFLKGRGPIIWADSFAKRRRRKMTGEKAYQYSSEEKIPIGYRFLEKISSGLFRGNIR